MPASRPRANRAELRSARIRQQAVTESGRNLAPRPAWPNEGNQRRRAGGGCSASARRFRTGADRHAAEHRCGDRRATRPPGRTIARAQPASRSGRAQGRPEPDDLRTAHRAAAIAPSRSDSALRNGCRRPIARHRLRSVASAPARGFADWDQAGRRSRCAAALARDRRARRRAGTSWIRGPHEWQCAVHEEAVPPVARSYRIRRVGC